LDLQIGFGDLNLQVFAGVTLSRDEREEMLVAAAGKKVRDVERRESERI
jgi:hypothetical protein